MATPTGTMAPMRPTETRRRRRTPSMSSSGSDSDHTTVRGEAHYRDVLLLLQSEFSRVVAALETRATSLEEHNEALQSEVLTLREELTAAKEAQRQQQSEANEQQLMLREESESRAAAVAENERKWREECERLRVQLQNEQKQWELERETRESEAQRVAMQLTETAARLAGEQQTNVTMSQELQLLQCRVNTAVATSRSFEARLQELKQLKRDEKADYEAHVAHLKRRLEDKKQQNQYLTEALMDKESRRAARAKEPLQLKDHAKKPSSRRVARDHEELQSHAPTSPTSSASPLLSPTASSLFTTSRPTTAASTATVSASVTQPRESSKTSRTRGSDRLQRELDDLRRKISACMTTETTMAARP